MGCSVLRLKCQACNITDWVEEFSFWQLLPNTLISAYYGAVVISNQCVESAQYPDTASLKEKQLCHLHY